MNTYPKDFKFATVCEAEEYLRIVLLRYVAYRLGTVVTVRRRNENHRAH